MAGFLRPGEDSNGDKAAILGWNLPKFGWVESLVIRFLAGLLSCVERIGGVLGDERSSPGGMVCTSEQSASSML